ncbi:hypothetical protein [Evansella tamaricis]|uniref:Uncharacterized protein n=1 Tax=Evansella tamaricis TaxID=2069301 RepID=A0ABS6JBU1_9BACI|nr:hypothetical protein [Evansella tamaricis]MBU9711152.1 hypothetical protein [Evansella tamaricis]
MKAILVEIGSSRGTGKESFKEMTELAAVQLHLVDGIIVTGGTFHSFIRPVFQHWKKKRANHPNYPNWWLAQPFPKVMEKFNHWHAQLGEIPWIVWNHESINIFQENSKRHEFPVEWGSEIIFLKHELEKRSIPFPTRHTSSGTKSFGNKESYTAIAADRAKRFSQLVSRKLLIHDLDFIPFSNVLLELDHLKEAKKVKREKVIINLQKIIENGKLSLEEVAEWSRLSTAEVTEILQSDAPLTPFERERMNNAWITWKEVESLRDQWIDS